MITQAKQEKPQLSIRQLCSSLQVNRRWYYARLAQSEEADADVDLRDAIEQLILEFAGYGYRRVTHALVRAGWSVNHKRVLRIMRAESLTQSLKAAVCANNGLASSVSGVPTSGERPASGCARCGLGFRYHVYSRGSAASCTWLPYSTPIPASVSDGTCLSVSIPNWRLEQ